MENQKNCKERVRAHYESRLEDIRKFAEYGFCDFSEMDGRDLNGEDTLDDLVQDPGEFLSYGLCFDFVEPGTFDGQRAGFYRYQLSTGGPGDEFRAYGDGRIEYWFLDWYDGASIDCTDEPAVRELFSYFAGAGMMDKFDGLVSW